MRHHHVNAAAYFGERVDRDLENIELIHGAPMNARFLHKHLRVKGTYPPFVRPRRRGPKLPPQMNPGLDDRKTQVVAAHSFAV